MLRFSSANRRAPAPRSRLHLRLAAAGALLASLCGGCHWTLTDAGTDPKSYQLDFPTGLAVDPAGQYLYVSNGNADLAYGGGTLMVIDMLRYECAVAWFRLQHGIPKSLQIPPVCDTPAAMAQAMTDIANARCQGDPYNPSVVDCDESDFILQNSTVKIGNFAGEIRLERFSTTDGNGNVVDDQSHRRLFVAVRGDPSVTWADVRFPSNPGDYNKPGIIRCTDNQATLTHPPGYDPTTMKTRSPSGCDDKHLIQQYVCKNLPSCTAGRDNMGLTQLSTEPFGIQLDQGSFPDGQAYARLLVSHQQSGQVSLIDDVAGLPTLIFTSNPFFTPNAQGDHGAFGLAQQHRHDPASSWYLTSNLSPQLNTFRIAQANVILLESQLSLQATYAFGNDLRDIQFEPSGNRAFLTENNPPSVLTLDTRVIPGPNGGLPQNVVTSSVDVCQTPSHMGVRRFYVPGAAGEPPALKTRVYVVCFLSSQVMVIDPDLPDVLDTIFAGIGGPNEIAFNFSSVDADPKDSITSPLPHRAYVSNFTESTIGIIDLEPGSPTENRVIARLGFPPSGPQP